MKSPLGALFHGLVIAAVVAAIVTGFFIIGSPSQERARRLDDQRSNDLQQISSAIDQYYNLDLEHLLPATLDSLRSDPRIYVASLVDPRSGEPYGYLPSSTSSTSYQLCATFETDTAGTPPSPYVAVQPRPVSGPGQPPIWQHGVGSTCFPFNVNSWAVPPKP